MRTNILLTLITFLFANIGFALTAQSEAVTGEWYSTRNNLVITVYQSRNGIEVTRNDNNETYYYNYVDDRTYADRRGNQYYFVSDQVMEFRKHDGRQTISFYRSENADTYDRKNGDNYNDNQYWKSRRAADVLEGRWYHRNFNNTFRIHKKRRNIHVKYRGSHRTYYPISHTTFEDKYGNRIKLKGRNQLIFFSRKHRRPLVFNRYPNRRYGCE